jgi:hypothetical protein
LSRRSHPKEIEIPADDGVCEEALAFLTDGRPHVPFESLVNCLMWEFLLFSIAEGGITAGRVSKQL